LASSDNLLTDGASVTCNIPLAFLWSILKVALLIVVLLTVQASSQEWEQFGFRKFAFGFDVSPGFILKETTKNGGGATFEAGDGGFLTVWGDSLPKENFKAAVEAHLNADEIEGWDVTYRRITPTWASYSGIKDGRIRYFRAIAICNHRVGIFQLDYDVRDKVPYDPIVVRMVRSLKEDSC
jgi:hypothetical protein